MLEPNARSGVPRVAERFRKDDSGKKHRAERENARSSIGPYCVKI
jgi:hypothetical protein